MSLTPSTMLELGTPAPDFELPEVDGGTVSLDDAGDAKAIVVMFICRHCPFVKHLEDQLAQLGRDYGEKGVAFFAICSNDADNYPEDKPEKLAEQKERVGFPFPYLVDADQSVAKAYRAACTPDFFVFDANRELFYRGQIDDSRPDSGIEVTGEDIRAALDRALAGEEPPSEQIPSAGCNIKWKEGNEPEYA